MENRRVLRYQVKLDSERFPSVDNAAIFVGETVDAMQAPTGSISSAEKRVATATATLWIGLTIQVLGQR